MELKTPKSFSARSTKQGGVQMKGKIAGLAVVLMFLGMIAFPAIVRAALEEGKTTQGEYASWLVREVGAQSKLPPAATGKDAIDFLLSLGIAPEGGWEEDEPVTKEMLASLLDDGGDASGSFDEVANNVKNHVSNILSDRKLGAFRAAGVGASGSTPTV